MRKLIRPQGMLHQVEMLTLLIGASILSRSEAAYFNVHQGEEKCFVENIAEHQVMTVKYRHLENPGVECMLVFKDSKHKQVFSKRVAPEDKGKGNAIYMTQSKGEHRICIQCKGASRWFQQTALKWELHVDMGDMMLTQSPATKKHITGTQRSVMETLARLEAVTAENEYEKISETHFRDASEAVNSHVVLVGIFIMVLEGLLVVWQINNLWGFFRREKII
eukprot:TRINITY_DN13364_c1_g1_i1.p1 TRINITY_DN13364_c1_g1~~TRINITY_DN13364_c1_g1_i1.p1  ORF type:complete len:221 (+),score=45.87 TRINITY_DN13364_c1_g1_i1:69-731(+)